MIGLAMPVRGTLAGSLWPGMGDGPKDVQERLGPSSLLAALMKLTLHSSERR